MKDAAGQKTVAENRKARHSYEIVSTIEAGVVLSGSEVKSLREGKANVGESYASFESGELWLINSYLPEFLQANRFNHAPRRHRKLLVHRREMDRLASAVHRDGMTLVPLRIYFNEKGRAKVELAREGPQEPRQARGGQAEGLEARAGPPAA